MSIPLNYWAILLSAIASMVIGGVWYSHKVFGIAWMKLSGKTKADIKGANTAMGYMFLTALIMAYVLAHFVYLFGAKGFAGGLQLGIWAWLGLIATTMSSNYIFEGRPWKLFLINGLFRLVEVCAMTVILSCWR